jgi:hypothetical protein
MNVRTPVPERHDKAGDDQGVPPGSELKATLWVLAVLIAVLELVWWIISRMYAP